MTNKRFTVFDGDSHVVEAPELWSKYLEPEYRTLGKHALWREEGKFGSYLKVNGKMFRDTMNSNIPRHAIWKPGMTWDNVGELDPRHRHPMTEGASNPQARLRDMDAMGVDQAFLYPTWFAEGFHLVEDPDVAYALARAYNDWIADFCKAAPDRLFAAAMVPLQNMDYAVEELRRIAKIACFRGAFIRPMFIEGHYLTHPYYEPLWAELENLGITAAVHSASGLWNPEWTSHAQFFEKVKRRLNQRSAIADAGGGPHAGGGGDQGFTFVATPHQSAGGRGTDGVGPCQRFASTQTHGLPGEPGCVDFFSRWIEPGHCRRRQRHANVGRRYDAGDRVAGHVPRQPLLCGVLTRWQPSDIGQSRKRASLLGSIGQAPLDQTIGT